MEILHFSYVMEMIIKHLEARDWAHLCLIDKGTNKAVMRWRRKIRARFYKFMSSIIIEEFTPRYAYKIHDSLKEAFEAGLDADVIRIYAAHPNFVKQLKDSFMGHHQHFDGERRRGCGACEDQSDIFGEYKQLEFQHRFTKCILLKDYNKYMTSSPDHSIRTFLSSDQYIIHSQLFLKKRYKFNEITHDTYRPYGRALSCDDEGEALLISSKCNFDLRSTKIYPREDSTIYSGVMADILFGYRKRRGADSGIVLCRKLCVSWHRRRKYQLRRERSKSLPVLKI